MSKFAVMAIKLYGHPLSAPVQSVMFCLEEKALQYEFVHIDLPTGQHKKEPFLSISPFGKVPALQDGDLKLFESRAITRYLAHNYADKGTPLMPSDPKKMALVSVWMEVESNIFEDTISKLSYGHQEKLGKILEVYEARLAESKYLGGEEFSLADLHHLPVINYLSGTLFDGKPNMSAWYAAMLARPAWQKVVERMKHSTKK
ncbi:hypothetical protein BUALT_Bualt13G0006100 [Buddleja alternifolia]|uniref:glutathione transferase n=1 Tax=Buddleja alternifolia TaxID=168488 RepID=A0AAV6WUM9_9LAMI|nr:hypothetical protein BUALT_Bualt13G0006100 [Buddleja alternifolia]